MHDNLDKNKPKQIKITYFGPKMVTEVERLLLTRFLVMFSYSNFGKKLAEAFQNTFWTSKLDFLERMRP